MWPLYDVHFESKHVMDIFLTEFKLENRMVDLGDVGPPL